MVIGEKDVTSLTLDGENPFWNVPRDLSKMTERTWAFLTIKQLFEERMMGEEDMNFVREKEKEILRLSLKVRKLCC